MVIQNNYFFELPYIKVNQGISLINTFSISEVIGIS